MYAARRRAWLGLQGAPRAADAALQVRALRPQVLILDEPPTGLGVPWWR
jgi:hypothetical protein